MKDPISDFFKKFPEIVPGIISFKEDVSSLDSSVEDVIFSVSRFDRTTWGSIEKGVKKFFEPAVVQRTFPSMPSSNDGGRGYIVRKDAMWLITFSRSPSYGRRVEGEDLRCSIRGSTIRPSQ